MVIHMIILAAFLFSRWRTPSLLHFPRPELLVLLIALAAIAQGAASKPCPTFTLCMLHHFSLCMLLHHLCPLRTAALLFPLHAAPLFPLHAAPLQPTCRLSCRVALITLPCCPVARCIASPQLHVVISLCVHVVCLAVQLSSPNRSLQACLKAHMGLSSPNRSLQACLKAHMGPRSWTLDMSL